ncbi:glycosyltransferase family 9 protein [Helicobacter acinonychis]|uniref:glycosyltransferase family 9 protein n=1 Tax=Helicobacter acinonychis TaxID=212 RepID=UPI000CF07F97|nr:hypothetical protein [Helicobacter acinonychis]STP04823.1 phosphorylase [Helicobacter acinonychis]
MNVLMLLSPIALLLILIAVSLLPIVILNNYCNGKVFDWSWKLFRLSQFLIDKLLSIAPIKSQNPTEKALCVVRLDVVGDYLLTRNFFAPLKEHYKDYKIVFIGNSVVKDLSVVADSPYIDEFIFLDHSVWHQFRRYTENRRSFHTIRLVCYLFKFIIKRYNELLMLKKTHYEIAISPILPFGDILRDDIVMKHLNASVKLAVRYEPFVDRNHYLEYFADSERLHFYTHCFCIPKVVRKFLFEYHQDLFSTFFKTFKGVDLAPVPFGMELPPPSVLKESSQGLLNGLSRRYGVLNLGASDFFRCYRYFNRIVRYAFIVSGGSSWVFFHPYPKTLYANQHVIYPTEFAILRKEEKFWEQRDVNTIKPSAVITSIKEHAPHLLKENIPDDIDEDYFIEEI